ncbi:MAG: AraC family transcriptional regulator [Sneathiella sp.]
MASIAGGVPLFSEGDVATQLICGHYEYRGDLHHPLITQLPNIIHIKSREMAETGDLHSLVSVIIGELSAAAPGAKIIVEKLAEVILVKLLRLYLATVTQPKGFLAALNDDRLVHALNFMHGNSHENIPLEEIAQAAGMSRSSFSDRFKGVTGLSPVVYLARWRMFLACDMLRIGDLSLVQVAENIGYESEISFSRAFKRYLNVTPAEYRRQAS